MRSDGGAAAPGPVTVRVGFLKVISIVCGWGGVAGNWLAGTAGLTCLERRHGRGKLIAAVKLVLK